MCKNSQNTSRRTLCKVVLLSLCSWLVRRTLRLGNGGHPAKYKSEWSSRQIEEDPWSCDNDRGSGVIHPPLASTSMDVVRRRTPNVLDFAGLSNSACITGDRNHSIGRRFNFDNAGLYHSCQWVTHILFQISPSKFYKIRSLSHY